MKCLISFIVMWYRVRCDHLALTENLDHFGKECDADPNRLKTLLDILAFETHLGILHVCTYISQVSTFYKKAPFLYAWLRNNSEPSSCCEMTLFLNIPLSWASMTGVFDCMLLAKCRLLLNSCTVTSSSLDMTSPSPVLIAESRDFSGEHIK